MRLTTPALALCAALPLALLPTEQEVVFAPKEGLELTIDFTSNFMAELTGGEMKMVVNDEEVQSQELPEMEVKLTDEENIVIQDVLVSVADGRATKVQRTFKEMTKATTQEVVDPAGEESSEDDSGESEFAGKTIVFEWDEEEEEYTKSYLEEDGDEELLEKLKLQGHLIGLLPSDPVSEGDDWEIEVTAFAALSEPAGDVSWKMESDEEDEEEDDFSEQFNANLGGEFLGEYKGTRDEDGREVAVIALTAELETEVVQESEQEVSDEEGNTGTLETTEAFEFTFELEGELLWDLEAGHAVALTLAGELTFTREDIQNMGGDDMTLELKQVQEFEGTISTEIACE